MGYLIRFVGVSLLACVALFGINIGKASALITKEGAIEFVIDSLIRLDTLGRDVYINPFTQHAYIDYELLSKSRISLRIYDISGRCVKILVDEDKKPGYYTVSFDAKGLSTGMYFAKLEAREHKEVKKLILMKK